MPFLKFITQSSKDFDESLYLSLLTRTDTYENQIKIGVEDMINIIRDDKIKNVHYDFKTELTNDVSLFLINDIFTLVQ